MTEVFNPWPSSSGTMVPVLLELTERCGLRCPGCYQGDDKKARPGELSFQDYRDIVYPRLEELRQRLEEEDESGSHYEITLSFLGGDLFLKEEIYKLLSEAKKMGFRIALLANPQVFAIPQRERKELGKIEKQLPDIKTGGRSLARVLKEEFGVEFIQFSLHGTSREVHQAFTGSAQSFDYCLRAIEQIQEAGMVAKTMFVLQKENAHQLLDMIRLAYERKIWLTVDRKVPQPLSPDIIPPEELRELYREAHYLDLKLAASLNGGHSIIKRKCHLFDALTRAEEGDPSFKIAVEKVDKIWAQSKDKIVIDEGCGTGSVIVISPSGDIIPCTKLADHKLSNIRTLPLDGLKSIFKDILPVYLYPGAYSKCRKCILQTQCRGCPAIAQALSGSFHAHDPQCWRDPDTPLNEDEARLREKHKEWLEGEGLKKSMAYQLALENLRLEKKKSEEGPEKKLPLAPDKKQEPK